MSTDLERFYTLLTRLAALPGQGQPLRTYTGRSSWPARGVYFFKEPGEARGGMETHRVVRVGTHALFSGSKSKLWTRLRTHRGTAKGRGNHRGSVFRLHVGAALLNRDPKQYQSSTWGVGASASRAVREPEVEHEERVSSHIGSMPVLWVDVNDDPNPDSLRSFVERNAIALLSACLNPHDPPSPDWLGLHSPRPEIQRSGLWNINHVSERYDPAFLHVLATSVAEMEAAPSSMLLAAAGTRAKAGRG